jgi:transcriptional regulator with XRE-family HTH domain
MSTIAVNGAQLGRPIECFLAMERAGGIGRSSSGYLNVRHMRNSNRLGEVVKRQREALGLTQRSLAQKLGVESSHVAFIESGRRKPSLKLVARLADVLDLDRQDLLIQAHPEAKELIDQAKPEERRKTSRHGAGLSKTSSYCSATM